MSLTKVLENWSDYDNKKKKGEDANFFSCTESWEVDYLVNKIKKVFPSQTTDAIVRAIQACCSSISAPRPRRVFVECVLRRLGLLI
ncbi:MAG TPA: hypothetical protein VIN08_20270 [Ohtaekwangia sp.]|uniref:hypothetical protein n=1 Tax=Ohtaekwangia sp. TaxID=2066019 RepID=UPI002F9513B0